MELHKLKLEYHFHLCLLPRKKFEPYFYLECPPGMGPQDISLLSKILENSSSFLKIIVALPSMVTTCRGIFRRGIKLDEGTEVFTTYESDVSFTLRFMIDCNLVGSNWIEIPGGKYEKTAEKVSQCQLQIDCPYPHAWKTSSIANLVTVQGQDEPFVRNVMTLKSCSPIIGVNVLSFDTENEVLSAWKRAETLGIAEFILGRMRNTPSRLYGTRDSKEVTIEGRIVLDLLQAIEREHDLRSYSLNSVSAHFLNEQKEHLDHSVIYDLQDGNSETRRRLAVYCLKVNDLCAVSASEESKTAGSSYSTCGADWTRGTFEGATVLEPRAGLYEKPITVLDFASLYPSIMMANNLCYCTLLSPGDAQKLNLPPGSVSKTPSGEIFVKSHIRKGILPEILEELLAARRRAKADLKEAKDPFVKAVLDGRQLAFKKSANSVHGFTGCTAGPLPCLQISSSVTSYGRQMIEKTKTELEDKFTVVQGHEHDAKVIYGDTDSVMVQFGVPSVEAAMNLGRDAAVLSAVSSTRYAGLCWTNPTKFDKIDSKGEPGCSFYFNMKFDRDVPGAAEYVKSTVSDLLMNRMDTSLLVITKGLKKPEAEYGVKTAHAEVAARMREDFTLLICIFLVTLELPSERDAATAPNVGDRVPYVMIKAAKGVKVHERSEDPARVLEKDIPIDTQYYLENQISKPLLRIFDPILKNASKELFQGSHTRSISISTPSNSGIMKYAVKQPTCIGCKALISNSDRALCSHCKGREAELYCKSIANVADLEELSGKLWTQCQECQGSLHQDVLCTRCFVSIDCILKDWFFGSNKCILSQSRLPNILSEEKSREGHGRSQETTRSMELLILEKHWSTL
ncbi:hypothetical protein DH2020_038000 [Rehmannia glutinosa]|uniref:DNA polymerase n=1 Tax=Rehmannia glutinosa TaxID=99300 RepID=A0ABR0V1J8_REHGL